MGAVTLLDKNEYEQLLHKQEDAKKNAAKTTMTKAQESVTKARNCDILVSAAAGSGKTWVLVKRILKRIIEDRVEVNRFLIVTFTKAAAAEMRERISKAIEEALEQAISEHSDQELIAFLSKQTTLVYQAQISTIDSFCRDVVKQYFMQIDLEPNLRIAEETELAVIRSEVMEEVLECAYQESSEPFLHFVECYATGREDTKLEEMIYQLYQFSMAHPSPEKWLKHAETNIQKEDIWFDVILQHAQYVLADLFQLQQETYAFANDNGASAKALEAIADDGVYIQTLWQASKNDDHLAAYDEIHACVKAHGRYPTMYTKGMDTEDAQQLKRLRDSYKNGMKKEIETGLFEISREILDKNRMAVISDMRVLFQLCQSFRELYAQEKLRQHVTDFADIEHMALAILTDENEQQERIPNDIANQLRGQYEEIMIDEYQDSNFLQEAILDSIAGGENGGYNRFMVGDMKQSIYRFRLASPELFVGKYQHFADYQEEQENPQVKIELDQNFRSSANVLLSTNYLFFHVMKSFIGNITYDEKAALKPGARYEQPVICPEYAGVTKEVAATYQYDTDTELLLYEPGEEIDTEIDKVEEEARMVAGRIQEMMGEHPYLVKDALLGGLEDSQYRPVTYRDIVILLRSPGALADRFVNILTDYGIPAFAESKTGYFSAMEVRNVLSYLTVINNSTIDIALAAVLRSAFYQITAKEMSLIYLQTKELQKVSLMERIKYFLKECSQHPDTIYKIAKEMEESEQLLQVLCDKLTLFLGQFQTYQNLAKQVTVCELIKTIYEETGYLNFVSTLPAGERRKANLYMLLEKAKEYEKTNFCGLFQFIRYIERLQKYELDFGESSLLGEEDDVVRIMSIHKSKGLEFPVVFVSGLAKQFNESDTKANVLLHADLGVGPYLIDPELRTKQKTIMRSAIQLVSHKDMLGEELRVLYVALTRAKDKLILTGAVEKLEKELQSVPANAGYVTILNAKNYLQWILMAFGHHSSMQELFTQYGIQPPEYDEHKYEKVNMQVKTYTKASLDAANLLGQTHKFKEIEMLSQELDNISKQTVTALADYLAYEYRYQDITVQKGKYSVSQLKSSQIPEKEFADENIDAPEFLFPNQDVLLCEDQPEKEDVLAAEKKQSERKLPRFLQQEKEVSGAMLGTAVHKFMELYDFSKGFQEEEYQRVFDELKNRGIQISPKALSSYKIKQFFQSELAQEMVKAAKRNELYKEAQFVVGFPITEMAQDIGITLKEQEDTDETVLVQGIIDAYYKRQDGTYVIMDYKTDKVQSAEELRKRYEKQLQYYTKTLTQITAGVVAECKIYSFALGKEIDVF